MWKNPVKYFAMGVHQKYRYERITKALGVTLWMDMIDFLHNLLSY